MTTEIQSVVARMTLEEKAALCTGANTWSTTPVDRLGIPEMIVSDGPHGVRRIPDVHSPIQLSLPATCFPTASCLGSTWDPDLIRAVGNALAEECIALNVDVLLGPGVNMKRSPLGGRNFEYYSEDPFLAGELAVAFIDGVQAKGVGTSLKHFAANNQEFQRFSINAEIDERTLREIYLPAFEKAVTRARPWSVMCSYNKVNGTFASQHHELLTTILKEEWGFEGLVVSDWGAVRDRVEALRAGLDWEMPGPQDRRVKAVVEAVRSGELDEALLDESARRILRIVFMAKETAKGGTFDVDAHHQLARTVAADGMVLLKNDGLLPLAAVQRVAVIGRAAAEAHFQGGGSSHINPTRVDIPLEQLRARAPGSDFVYAEGYPSENSLRQDLIDEAAVIAAGADVAVICIGLPTYKESEGYDRTDLDLTDQQVALIHAVAGVQPRTVVVLNNGAPVAMGPWIDDVSAVIEGRMMGQAGAAAIADILYGVVNPSGKLAETFPLTLASTPAFLNWPGDAGRVRYGEGLYIGYRYYDAKELPVLFPFGHGLSYTTFAYGNPGVSASTFKDLDGLTVTVDVTNTGAVAGKETVQVYVRDFAATMSRPVKELKGFAKVHLEPGESRHVSIDLDFRAFAFWHPKRHQWVTESGAFEILVGASSADIRCRITVNLELTLELPCILDEESTMREWMDDPRGKQVLGALYAQVEAEARKVFGESDRYGTHEPDANGNGSGVGMDVLDMMNDMPVVSVLLFQQSALTMPADEIVAGLLRQVKQIGTQVGRE